MRNRTRFAAPVGILALAMTFLVPQPTRAQIPINPDHVIGIFQEGSMRGEIIRVDGDDKNYVEHWVLYPDYVYPSVQNRVATQLIPGVKRYQGLEDFFERVPFEKGARYVKVVCEDGTELPNGRFAEPPNPDKTAGR